MAARKSKADIKAEESRASGSDPDAIVSVRVGEALEKALKRRDINLGRSECGAISLSIIIEFIQTRAMEWAASSPIRGIGDPDAQTVGIAEAVLSIIGEEGARHELPFDKAIGDWPKAAVAYFAAICFLAINDQRVATLERNGPREMEGRRGAKPRTPDWDDDEIPF
jgi:hypothetical protein